MAVQLLTVYTDTYHYSAQH